MKRFKPVILGILLVGLLGLWVWVFSGGVSGKHAPPAMFAKLSFDQAKEQATASGKLLLVDATASWCPPCQQMDRTTWVHPDMVAWVASHAIAVQLDVDEHPTTARTLGIRAMPTIIAFRDGVSVGRVVGYHSADQMLAWLQRLHEAEAPAGT